MSAQVVTLGCRLNLAESERMRAMFAADDGNVVIVNSCAVTSEAVRQTRQAIRKARRANPGARLMVTGCAADIERDQLGAMAEVDGLIPNARKLDARAWNLPVADILVAPTKTRAFVPVQNGCDHACTFCVIPQGRGTSRSLPVAKVLQSVEAHLDAGAKEIVLTGVDLTSWGDDLVGSPGLGVLAAAILEAFPHLPRLRLSSVDGIEIDPLLFELLAHEARLMPYLHLSLQHGHDLILKRMKRRHLRRDAIDLVSRLKELRPDIAIGADLIAGFPTETPDHHAANCSIIAELGIVHGHIFPYSPRPGTPAARMPQVGGVEIKQRAAELRSAVAQSRQVWLRSLIGTPLRILVEKDRTGHAENFARVRAPNDATVGDIATIIPKDLNEGLLE